MAGKVECNNGSELVAGAAAADVLFAAVESERLAVYHVHTREGERDGE